MWWVCPSTWLPVSPPPSGRRNGKSRRTPSRRLERPHTRKPEGTHPRDEQTIQRDERSRETCRPYRKEPGNRPAREREPEYREYAGEGRRQAESRKGRSCGVPSHKEGKRYRCRV